MTPTAWVVRKHVLEVRLPAQTTPSVNYFTVLSLICAGTTVLRHLICCWPALPLPADWVR
jgi:hypothetical protein